MVENENRRIALVNVIELKEPLADHISELRKFPWDSERTLVRLDLNHLKVALLNFLKGKISANEVCDWANAIECREDICLEKTQSDNLANYIFILANPEIEGPLTRDLAASILKIIEKQVDAI